MMTWTDRFELLARRAAGLTPARSGRVGFKLAAYREVLFGVNGRFPSREARRVVRCGGRTVLEGRNIILRLFREDDLDEFLQLENTYAEMGDFAPVRFRSPPQFRKNFSETGAWEEDLGRMMVTDKKGKRLGQVMFFKEAPYQSGYEVGYGIYRREDRGKGYMTEALRIFSAYLFELKSIPRLQITTAEGNIAARRIAEKCGYRHEGTMRRYGFIRGEYVDAVQYALLREECPSLAEALAG
jgi:ribosomal-protein-alanine N-acetyltransferase